MWACGEGHLDIVKVLIDNRADFNYGDKVSSGSLPLYSRACLVKVCIVWINSTNVGMWQRSFGHCECVN